MSWLSDLIDFVTKMGTIDFVITPARSGGKDGFPAESYISVRVLSMRLPNSREQVFNKLYAVMHGFLTVQRFGDSPATLASTTMPSDLEGVSRRLPSRGPDLARPNLCRRQTPGRARRRSGQRGSCPGARRGCGGVRGDRTGSTPGPGDPAVRRPRPLQELSHGGLTAAHAKEEFASFD